LHYQIKDVEKRLECVRVYKCVCACVCIGLDVINYLLESSVGDPMAAGDFNDTPPHLAASNGHLAMVKFFLENLS